MRHLLSLLLLSALTACNPGVAGSWVGQLTCPGVDGTYGIDVQLDRVNGDMYGGEMVAEITEYIFSGGDDYDIWVEAVFDMGVVLDGKGAQKLDYSAEAKAAECKGWRNGDLEYSSCDELGMDLDLGAEIDLGAWRWDGQDTVTIADDGCEGTIGR